MANKGSAGNGAGSDGDDDDDVSATSIKMVFEKWNVEGMAEEKVHEMPYTQQKEDK